MDTCRAALAREAAEAKRHEIVASEALEAAAKLKEERGRLCERLALARAHLQRSLICHPVNRLSAEIVFKKTLPSNIF